MTNNSNKVTNQEKKKKKQLTTLYVVQICFLKNWVVGLGFKLSFHVSKIAMSTVLESKLTPEQSQKEQ